MKIKDDGAGLRRRRVASKRFVVETKYPYRVVVFRLQDSLARKRTQFAEAVEEVVCDRANSGCPQTDFL